MNDRNISTIIKTKNRSKNQKNSNRKNRNKQKIDSNLKLLASSNQAELFRNEPLKTCLIADSCGKKNSKHSTGYCYRPHEPYNYSVDDPEIESFYDMMLESCPHFFNEDGWLRRKMIDQKKKNYSYEFFYSPSFLFFFFLRLLFR